jgi:predicted TIM-barrel fold metal-dependent hydrolase
MESLISRRAFMLGVMAAAIAACASPVIRTPREEVSKYPLFDVHSHRSPSGSPTGEEFLEIMNAAGISRMNVFERGGPDPMQLAQQYPDRFVVSYRPPINRSTAMRGIADDEEVRRIGIEVEKALRSGLYKGLGEVNTYRSAGSGAAPSNISPDSPLIRSILELAGRYNVPINIHCPADNLVEMDHLLRAYPQTVVIWAHAGFFLSPSVVGEFLQAFPNLYFDLALVHPPWTSRGRIFGSATRILNGQVIHEGWRQLFESYPDRFLVGFDFGAQGNPLNTPHSMAKEVGEYFRSILVQLTSTTARKIAYENAEKVYKLH